MYFTSDVLYWKIAQLKCFYVTNNERSNAKIFESLLTIEEVNFPIEIRERN